MIYYNLGSLPSEIRSVNASISMPRFNAARMETPIPISRPSGTSSFSRARGPGIGYLFQQ
jgi:hypothetical protein